MRSLGMTPRPGQLEEMISHVDIDGKLYLSGSIFNLYRLNRNDCPSNHLENPSLSNPCLCALLKCRIGCCFETRN